MNADERLGWTVRRLLEEAQAVGGSLGAVDCPTQIAITVDVSGMRYHLVLHLAELQGSYHQPINEMDATKIVAQKIHLLKATIAEARAGTVPTHMPKEIK